MRSDRNPYFILKHSKNAEIQSWLSRANTLTQAEITELPIKQDLKKAMLFVQTFGDQQKSNSTAELLASIMQQAAIAPCSANKEIWRYNCQSCWVRCRKTSIEVNAGDYFIKDQEKIFLKHNWIQIKDPSVQLLLQDSCFCCMGDFNQLNYMTSQWLGIKYNSLLR